MSTTQVRWQNTSAELLLGSWSLAMNFRYLVRGLSLARVTQSKHLFEELFGGWLWIDSRYSAYRMPCRELFLHILHDRHLCITKTEDNVSPIVCNGEFASCGLASIDAQPWWKTVWWGRRRHCRNSKTYTKIWWGMLMILGWIRIRLAVLSATG